MVSTQPCLLTVNAGSSTIRYALFRAQKTPAVIDRGKLTRVGAGDFTTAVEQLSHWLQAQHCLPDVIGVGHRVVHGMQHATPQLIDDALVDELERLTPFDPLHLPSELALIAALRQQLPHVPHVACFDTAFHRSMPLVARLLPIPRRYQAAGIERYGFHGLSYAYCMDALQRCGDAAATRGRVILAHLGNGASLAAVRDGHSIDTSMGFTPDAGIPMGTRSGDLDPGIGYYLARTEGMTAEQFHHLVSKESGLLGISATSSDLQELLALEGEDDRAADAIALFCYQVRKSIGSFAAALGGVDTLVFTGGIGENAPLIRSRICKELAFLGIAIEEVRNTASAALISTGSSRVAVRVIPTDEEQMLARAVWRLLDKP